MSEVQDESAGEPKRVWQRLEPVVRPLVYAGFVFTAGAAFENSPGINATELGMFVVMFGLAIGITIRVDQWLETR